ncbi:NUDIX domain-containing protein [Halovenus rubra]|uniref:NUDIX domain-containing protein n=2 Tax=Halovenus rubra TaxID=869890 RepID=A0ACC7DWL9_9EURY|nr:NUDIX domain-containing protein [Halovenus rubra]
MKESAYIVNVDGAVVRDGEYLFIERGEKEDHAAGILSFPGGKIEATDGGDAIRAAARREIAEEVGVEVGTVEYVTSSMFEDDTGTPCLNVVTLCEYVDGEAHAKATDEVATIHWLSPTEARDHDDVPRFVAEYVDTVEAVRADE